MHLALSSLLATTVAVASALSIRPRGDTRQRAAYTLSNDAAGAHLLALSISVEDGTVSNPTLTSTGGKGLLGRNANGTAGPDGLFGQGAVTVSQDVSFFACFVRSGFLDRTPAHSRHCIRKTTVC